MSTPTRRSVWQEEDIAAAFIDGRRELIPLWDAQEELVRRLLARVERPIRRFCDLGAGDGGFAELVLDACPGSTCVLIDFSEPMLQAARSRLAGRAGGWQLVEADLSSADWLEALPDRGPFDAVLSRFCIHHLPHGRKRELYREAFALLAPGGLFLNWEHVAGGGLVEGLFDEYFVERLLEAERVRPNPRPPEEVVRTYDEAADEDILAGAEEQCGWLRELGFEDVDVYFKLPELAIFGGTRSLNGQIRSEVDG